MPQLQWVEGNQLTIPYTSVGALSEGDVVVQGVLNGFVLHDVAGAGELVSLVVGNGIVKGISDNTDINVGSPVFWNDTTNKISLTATGNTWLGISLTDNSSTDSTELYVLKTVPAGAPVDTDT